MRLLGESETLPWFSGQSTPYRHRVTARVRPQYFHLNNSTTCEGNHPQSTGPRCPQSERFEGLAAIPANHEWQLFRAVAGVFHIRQSFRHARPDEHHQSSIRDGSAYTLL
jgi:hypothetical protein